MRSGPPGKEALSEGGDERDLDQRAKDRLNGGQCRLRVAWRKCGGKETAAPLWQIVAINIPERSMSERLMEAGDRVADYQRSFAAKQANRIGQGDACADLVGKAGRFNHGRQVKGLADDTKIQTK
jgi:hypothetical protein